MQNSNTNTENRQASVYKMNDCDWWCDYSIEEAKANYIKFAGQYMLEESDGIFKLTDQELNKYKYRTENDTTISFKEELKNRIDSKDIPSFFASTEW